MSVAELFDSIEARSLLLAATCNVSCALVGCYLVLRRMSLMGDALSHAVLPGLTVALLVSGSTGEGPMFLGALAAGIATTFLTQAVQRYGRIAPDASLGVVYTSLFALGVVLVKRYASDIHFDIQCVFAGSLDQSALDTVYVGGVETPRAFLGNATVLLLIVFCIALFWKELKISSFDPALAGAMGLFPGVMHYLLMLLVSLATVTAFGSIGSILVVAMLIGPAATAQLLVNRLAPMLLAAAGVALAATVLGYRVAVEADVSPAGSIAVMIGLLYVLAAFFSPKEGIVSRLWENTRMALRVRREDLLSTLFRREERGDPSPMSDQESIQIAGRGLLGRWAVRSVLRQRMAVANEGGLSLTEAGRTTGLQLVRSHRLWETYLVDQVGLQADHVHETAHLVEHVLDARMRDEIVEQLGDVPVDPHGRAIPPDKPNS